jgi:hypothetical protein
MDKKRRKKAKKDKGKKKRDQQGEEPLRYCIKKVEL